MSAVWENSAAHNDARRQASIDFADSGALNSRIKLYSTEFGDTSEPPCVVMVLAKPCGSVVSHKIVLQQLDPAGDLIAIAGLAVWGVWENGDGAVVSRSTVSDAVGAGPIKILGADGTLLRAGGRCRLGITELA